MSLDPTPMTANVPRSRSEPIATHWYGWFFVASSLVFPRICLLTFWIFSDFMDPAFGGSFALQALGFVFAPWTIMAYGLMWGLASDRVSGAEWIVVGVGVLLDLLTYIEGRRLLRS